MSTPSEVEPLKNSTLAIVPAPPVEAMSVAVALSASGTPWRIVVPLAGESSVTVGGGFAGTLTPPVTIKEQAWLVPVSVPVSVTVTV